MRLTSAPAPRLILGGVFLLIILLSPGAQTPSEELWKGFISNHPSVARIPEDRELGLLADRRNPDTAWAGALLICDRAFGSLSEGKVPVESLLPALKVPLERALKAALSSGYLEATVRYGLPQRSGDRLDVPLRLASPDSVGYGNIYLVWLEGKWFLEQWVLDLTPFTTGGNGEGSE